jgi:hypothetical protein
MTTRSMQQADPSRHIRRGLWISAAVCAVAGIVFIAAASQIAARMGWTAMPVGGISGAQALQGFGFILLPVAVLSAFAAQQRPFIPLLGWFFTGIDILWGFICWGALVAGLPMTTFGTTMIAIQATAIFALGIYEWWGMRQLRGVRRQA